MVLYCWCSNRETNFDEISYAKASYLNLQDVNFRQSQIWAKFAFGRGKYTHTHTHTHTHTPLTVLAAYIHYRVLNVIEITVQPVSIFVLNNPQYIIFFLHAFSQV